MEKDPVTNEEWRSYYLKEAESAMKEGLTITARECLKNAALFKELGDKSEITNKPMGQ